MIYKVSYHSMSASYGPSYIQADSEQEAKLKFGSCFTSGERAVCMSAKPISDSEIRQALHRRDEEN
jgi:hypothetical protein